MQKETLVTIELGQAGLWGLRAKVEKLNRRAKRHGMNELEVVVVRDFQRNVAPAGCDDEFVPRYDVEIRGYAPRIEGHRLIARVEFNDTIGTIVRPAPHIEDDGQLAGYRDHDGHCDHCGYARRRKDVFILADSNGEHKSVGRNCLADYLRNEDAADFARFAALLDQLSGYSDDGLAGEAYSDGFGGWGKRPTESLERFLTVTAMITRRLGWVSKSKARDDDYLVPTVSHVNRYLYSRDSAKAEWKAKNELSVCDDDRELARKAIDWAASLTPAQVARSEYLNVINRIAQVEELDWSLEGYAGSIIVAYQNAMDHERERREKNANAPEKVWFGSVKKRERDVPVRVIRVRYLESDWGVRTVVAMEKDMPDGKVAPLVWFASGEHNYDEGAEYTMTATVVDHIEDDRFGKQTKVNRATLKVA